jgi:hypothetical protein
MSQVVTNQASGARISTAEIPQRTRTFDIQETETHLSLFFLLGLEFDLEIEIVNNKEDGTRPGIWTEIQGWSCESAIDKPISTEMRLSDWGTMTRRSDCEWLEIDAGVPDPFGNF